MHSATLVLGLVTAGLALGSYQTGETPSPDLTDPRVDSVAVVGVVSRFHEALELGDTAAVKRLIAPDLRVLEGGEVENRSQYLANHLAADIDFAKGVRSERTVVSYRREGSVAWVISTSIEVGKFNGRDINSVGAESMILSRASSGWQIRAVHWSSAKRPTR